MYNLNIEYYDIAIKDATSEQDFIEKNAKRALVGCEICGDDFIGDLHIVYTYDFEQAINLCDVCYVKALRTLGRKRKSNG